MINTLTEPHSTTEKKQVIDKKTLARFMRPDRRKSLWQVKNSFIPYIILLIAMYFSLNLSYWLTMVLVIPTAGFFVRIFIIFHDCGHGAFFRSRHANNILGYIAGVITFVPYYHWNHKHARHHASAGDLDRRGIGDVWTLTIKEYQALSKWERLKYKIYRNPLIMLLIGPVYLFLINSRFVIGEANHKERYYVYWTNLAILVMALIAIAVIGIKAYLLIQLPVVIFAGAAGVWLFYVQHQFEGVYWDRHEKWDFQKAALKGSSFYQLPKVLQWFSGNIGFHHVHHLSSRIPNYYLESCHKQIPEFQNVKPVTLFASLKSLKYRLWDEVNMKLVGFGYLRNKK
jgi:omega-6 fatty acid desaturase (delta-12 desaturase)